MKIDRPAAYLVIFIFLSLSAHCQFKCSDNLLYAYRNSSSSSQSLIISWTPSSNGFNTNTSFTNCPVGVAGLIGNIAGLALMPNISGGTVSPTFFTTQYGAMYYWNGAAWVPNGATFGNDQLLGIGGCAGAIYALSYATSIGPFQLKKFTPPSTVTTLFTSTMVVAGGIMCDCDCNFYLLGKTALYKYDPNGNLLNTYNFVGMPFFVNIVTRFGIIGNTIYVVNANTVTYAISHGVGTITGNSVITSSMTNAYGSVAVEFAACPFSLPASTSISASTLFCNPPTASIVVSSTPSPLTMNWTGPSIVPPTTGSVVNVNAVGTYTCYVKNGFCTDTVATLVATVGSSISVVTPSIVPGNNLCYQSNLTLTASINTPQYSYKWLGPGLTTQNTNTFVTVPGPGLYSLSVTQNDNGCSGIATSSILSQPILNFGISTPTLCVYSIEGKNKAILTYSGATQYTLLVSPGFSLQLLPSQPVILYQTSLIINGGSAGSATVIGSNGVCSGSAAVNFSVLPLTQISVTPQNSLVCNGKTVAVHASGANKFIWFVDNTLLTRPADSVANVTVTGPLTFSVTGVDPFGCNTAPKTISLNVFPANEGEFTYPVPLCAPVCADLVFEAFTSKSNKVYSNWTINGVNYNKSSFKHCFSTAGQYTLSGTLRDSAHQCVNASEFVINVQPKPKADFIFNPKTPVEGLDEVRFVNTSSGSGLDKFNWYFNDNKGYTTTTKDASFMYMQAGQYKIAMLVTNQWRCADTIMKVVTVQEDFAMYVPNTFTPNDDNRNDVFMPVIQSAKLYDLKIFDRWGQEVFHTKTLNEGWDGFFKGEPCKQDVYNWTIEVSTLSGTKKSVSGMVSLIR